MKEYVGVSVAVVAIVFLLIVLVLKLDIRDWIRRTAKRGPGGAELVPPGGVSSTYAVWTKGSGRVVIQIYERQTLTGLKYFAPHYNEKTSISAAKEVINRHGGRLVELVHSGGRNIKFSIGEREYEFDPNRMFSDVGAKQSLEDHGGSSPSAVAAVRELASLCLAAVKIADPGLLIGAHNNTDGDFSICSYINDPEWEVFAELVNVDRSQDTDNFFFVTERGDYQYLVGKHYNAVLAKAPPPQDNGTLGVYCAFQSIPYANCEAQRGQFDFQKRMYEVLHNRPGPAVA
jgi:hypothetical protein